jgi:hypothetical protein
VLAFVSLPRGLRGVDVVAAISFDRINQMRIFDHQIFVDDFDVVVVLIINETPIARPVIFIAKISHSSSGDNAIP